VTSEAGAICHSKITTKLEIGNLYFSVTREKGKGEGGRRKHLVESADENVYRIKKMRNIQVKKKKTIFEIG
jgi:hypothetical protein